MVSLLANVWLWTTRDTSRVGYWRSDARRLDYLAAYDAVMKQLPQVEQTWDLQTDYGTVRAYRFATTGFPGALPVVPIPGWGSGTPMWKDNLPGLAAQRPVYALDALGDAGRSTQSAPLTSTEAQAKWIDQTLGELGVPRAHVVGHSFGGWSAMNPPSTTQGGGRTPQIDPLLVRVRLLGVQGAA
jgi:pimeloyl-ACP methyl ester carboxylesterase